MKKTNNTKETEKKTDKNAPVHTNKRKIAIIALICAATALIFTGICIGALSGLGDVPENSSKQNQSIDDDDWTDNY